MNLPLGAGQQQMIEIDAAGISEDGAEITLAVDDVRLPPVYLGIFGDKPRASTTPSGHRDTAFTFQSPLAFRRNAFAAQLWSHLWPVSPDAQIRISNYGPGPVTINRVRVRKGSLEKISRRAERNVPFPPVGRVELREILEQAPIDGIEDLTAVDQLPSLQGWLAQQRRRIAFERLNGLPLPMRLGERILGDVKVRGRLLEGGAAVVAVSRPNYSYWRPLGPGWLPPAAEARWEPLPKEDRYLPRSFRVQGALHSLAVFLADPSAVPGARESVVAGKLYRLDSPVPLANFEWGQITNEGRWFDLAFETPLAAGDYVLELKASAGNPAWLVWSRVREPIPGSDLTKPLETLLVHESPTTIRYDQAIPVRVMLAGRSSQIERYAGLRLAPQPALPDVVGGEIVLDANLRPGETEIFVLNDFRS